MTLFDQFVDSVLKSDNNLQTLRPVVEKEILHHEILSVLSEEGMLKDLTFMGGTCLRACYGSPRLSEDLDFAAQRDFDKNTLSSLKAKLEARLNEKYGFTVDVGEPKMAPGDTRTWKIRIVTRPESPHLPIQRIHLDVCSIPALERVPSLLINHYAGNLGTAGLILQVESREEILSDKYIALGLRPNRIKQRDIWDILWLRQQGIKLKKGYIPAKLKMRNIASDHFYELLDNRIKEIKTQQEGFIKEMSRFLPPSESLRSLSRPEWWSVACRTIKEGILPPPANTLPGFQL